MGMRILLSDFMSLDGVVQAPGGQGEDTDGGFRHGGWSMPYFEPETMGPAVAETMADTDALLLGRRTWASMAAAWPARAGDPFADRMNEIPKYVASRTLTAIGRLKNKSPWGTAPGSFSPASPLQFIWPVTCSGWKAGLPAEFPRRSTEGFSASSGRRNPSKR